VPARRGQLLERHFTSDELVERPDHHRLRPPAELLEPGVLPLTLERNARLVDVWFLPPHESFLCTIDRSASNAGCSPTSCVSARSCLTALAAGQDCSVDAPAPAE